MFVSTRRAGKYTYAKIHRTRNRRIKKNGGKDEKSVRKYTHTKISKQKMKEMKSKCGKNHRVSTVSIRAIKIE